MTLFKNKKKNNRPAVLYSIDLKIKEAREQNKSHFYYPLTASEVNVVRTYCLMHYGALVEVDHKTDNTIIYKIYGYNL